MVLVLVLGSWRFGFGVLRNFAFVFDGKSKHETTKHETGDSVLTSDVSTLFFVLCSLVLAACWQLLLAACASIFNGQSLGVAGCAGRITCCAACHH
jgi:hypothetical protein